MILPFSTQLNGQPTYFPEKIWKGLQPIDISEFIAHIDGKYLMPFFKRTDINSKLHTIRKDEKNRWNPGVMIDFFINTRKKDMFRFAPRIPVISTQKIVIKHYTGMAEVLIGDEWFGSVFHHGLDDIYEWNIDLETLAKNDGFESVDDFFQYFNEDFNGKIIHWTNLKYQ